MAYLLDTHAFIWFLENHSSLSTKARVIIEDEDNIVYISIATFYEMAIKLSVGKLNLGKPLKTFVSEAISHNFSLLPISENHILSYSNVPLIDSHRDPFDRLLIATALYEQLTIITADKQFLHYQSLVNILW